MIGLGLTPPLISILVLLNESLVRTCPIYNMSVLNLHYIFIILDVRITNIYRKIQLINLIKRRRDEDH